MGVPSAPYKWLFAVMIIASTSFATLGIVVNSSRFSQHKYDNIEPTIQFTGENEGFPKADDGVVRVPLEKVKAEKVDLKNLDRKENLLVWMGHSSIYLQIDGKSFLIDPVLCSSFPSNLMMKPFLGSDIWTPEDIPSVDYLIITHDHWDHLDKMTLRKIKSKIGQVYCGLDVGKFIKSCGYKAEQIHEMAWDDCIELGSEMKLHCLTSRHFSGRMLKRNPTLWASWLIESIHTVYLSGDGGYGKHFKDIGQRFLSIDLAIMENGQYSPYWKHIHMMPDELPLAIRDLSASKVFTYHHGKYALSHHDWREPEQKIREASKGVDWVLLDSHIGAIVKF